jgi:hypothetical protein
MRGTWFATKGWGNAARYNDTIEPHIPTHKSVGVHQAYISVRLDEFLRIEAAGERRRSQRIYCVRLCLPDEGSESDQKASQGLCVVQCLGLLNSPLPTYASSHGTPKKFEPLGSGSQGEVVKQDDQPTAAGSLTRSY